LVLGSTDNKSTHAKARRAEKNFGFGIADCGKESGKFFTEGNEGKKGKQFRISDCGIRKNINNLQLSV